MPIFTKINVVWLLPSLVSLLVVQAAYADQTIGCSSKHGKYTHCRIDDMRDKRARLSRQLSSTRCKKGQTWGTDKRGIWVDKGCRAEFRLSNRGGGGGYQRHNRDDDSTAAAVAVGAGIAAIIAAAAVSSSDGDRDSHRPSDYEAIPRFVYKRCNKRADREVQNRRQGRYAELDRIVKVKRRNNGGYRCPCQSCQGRCQTSSEF